MSARIEATDKEGIRWTVSGSNQTDLELGIAALRSSLAEKKERESGQRGPGRPRKAVTAANEADVTRVRMTLAILRAMQKAGDEGAPASSLFAAAGIKSDEPKALGPIMGMLPRVLRDYELSQEKVYRVSGYSPKKRWHPAEQMSAAINKLEGALEQMKY